MLHATGTPDLTDIITVLSPRPLLWLAQFSFDNLTNQA
jgi:hypothetical protein